MTGFLSRTSPQASSAAYPWGMRDPVAKLSQNDRIDCELCLVGLKPLNDRLIRLRPGGLAEDVGVDEVDHKLSVDSDSIGRKYPLSGQERSQSTSPSFGLPLVLTRR